MAYEDDSYETDIDETSSSGILARPNAVTCIINAVWSTALTEDTRKILARSGQKVAVVIAPDTTWVGPLERRIGALIGSGWASFGRDGSQRIRDRADVGGDQVVACLHKGQSVVGIAASAGILPDALTATADLTIELSPPDGPAVAIAVRDFLGLKDVPTSATGAGPLNLFELAACFRHGSARSIIDRIAAAQSGRIARFGEDIPELRSAVEFGAAREWGLALAEDVKAFRAGRLEWSAIEHSAILHSRPGLGKTTYCASLARHMGAELISTSISELFASSPGYLDSVIKALRDTYRRAEANKDTTLILFDEIDALPSRVGLDSRSASWWGSVITEFLLLSAVQRPNIIQIGATNFLERVDPALLRPGRFGRAIELEPPGPAGIESMLRFHLRGELADMDLSELGQIAAGSTAAEIMSVVQRARSTARAAQRPLKADDLLDAAVASDYEYSPDDLRRITIHEAGHATVSLALGVDHLEGIQLGGSGGLGSTKHRRAVSRLDTKQQIEDRVTMTLAGRAAELVCAGEISSGSNGDLQKATGMITAIHGALGLGDLMVAVSEDELDRELRYDPVLRRAVELDLRRLQKRAVEIVQQHRVTVEVIATALSTRRYVSGDEARAIFAGHPHSSPDLSSTQEAPDAAN